MKRRQILAAGAAGLSLPAIGQAQSNFPNRPITLQIAFPPGGATDVQMRAFADAATRAFGQQVIIENRPGGGATIPALNMRNTRPDGYTVAQFPLPAIRLPFMQRMAFNPRTDFTPITHLTGYLFATCVRAESPYQSWADLVADARARPGQLRMGNTGANGTPHLTMVDLAAAERLDIVHVPFRGEADAVPALLGGHIEASATGSGVVELVEQGKLRVLNVWSAERSWRWPNVPTLKELGYNMVVTSPYGLVGPLGMEPDIVRRLNEGFRTALNDPAHVAVLRRLDMPLEYLGPEDYAAFIQRTADEEEARVTRLGLRG
ncbi:Bug family tripartite tricarboxylate transporter substrate binding protein [Sabulicella glaciei]|uniref:Tripartite tricarboxylate transporter substrate binding protein n=1 Tax=Sabulicella glaciei TaxID=2984948 RepID=A0ABT3NR97_9PROT|nr:tripartite tricarboxylate transporter substrate binding protein [Roseococcus sp. MDT2-1-1]MCW8084682.1 tripartite tricarboxylate transporter substrate binding protein [Roseococcus sp. MDT2-1-1]